MSLALLKFRGTRFTTTPTQLMLMFLSYALKGNRLKNKGVVRKTVCNTVACGVAGKGLIFNSEICLTAREAF